MSTWFKRMASPKVKDDAPKASVPTGLFEKCPKCNLPALAEELEESFWVCRGCEYHFRVGPRDRLALFLDRGSAEELALGLHSQDPLEFKDSKSYLERIDAATTKTGEEEAFIVQAGRLKGREVIAGAFVFRFMGGSMGSVVGEKITRAFEEAYDRKCPVVLFTASGGARMQEGILSLMQMAKTSVALNRFREVRQPYVAVLTDPTTGGVAASFALLGDVIIAEPEALVGFAGPRVIEQTIRQKLPEGFQRSEFLLQHGVIDLIVPRRRLRGQIASLFEMLAAS